MLVLRKNCLCILKTPTSAKTLEFCIRSLEGTVSLLGPESSLICAKNSLFGF